MLTACSVMTLDMFDHSSRYASSRLMSNAKYPPSPSALYTFPKHLLQLAPRHHVVEAVERTDDRVEGLIERKVAGVGQVKRHLRSHLAGVHQHLFAAVPRPVTW